MASGEKDPNAFGPHDARVPTPKQRRQEVVDVLATGILGMIENGDWPPRPPPEAPEPPGEPPATGTPPLPRRDRYAVFNWTVMSRDSHMVTAKFERVRSTTTKSAKAEPSADEPARATLALVART